MFNLLRMDLYQMVKGKSFKVFSLVMVLCSVALAFTLWFVTTPTCENMLRGQTTQNMQNGSIIVGIGPAGTEEFTGGYEGILGSLFSMSEIQAIENGLLSGGLLMMLILIFVGITITSEFNSGFIKNVLTAQTSRTAYFASKMITIFIASSVLTLLGVGVSLICFTAFGLKFAVSPFGEILVWTALTILLILAMASLVALVSWLTRSKVAAVLVAVFVGSGLLVSLVSAVLALFPKLQEIPNFTLYNTLGSLRVNIESSDLTQTILVGCGFLLLYSVASFVVLKKKDI